MRLHPLGEAVQTCPHGRNPKSCEDAVRSQEKIACSIPRKPTLRRTSFCTHNPQRVSSLGTPFRALSKAAVKS